MPASRPTLIVEENALNSMLMQQSFMSVPVPVTSQVSVMTTAKDCSEARTLRAASAHLANAST